MVLLPPTGDMFSGGASNSGPEPQPLDPTVTACLPGQRSPLPGERPPLAWSIRIDTILTGHRGWTLYSQGISTVLTGD